MEATRPVLVIVAAAWLFSVACASTPVVEDEVCAAPSMGRLTCLTGKCAGKDFFLTEDLTTIGRIAGNTIVLVEAGVARRHGGILIEDMRFELADFGSWSGTFVNGGKITRRFLADGDEVRFGETKMRFSLRCPRTAATPSRTATLVAHTRAGLRATSEAAAGR